MPVRIIFRGLILFEIPESGDDKGKLVAELINKETIPNRPKKPTQDRPPRGPHEHNHGARIQIATDHGKRDELIPVELLNKEEITISLPAGGTDRPVRPERSFFDHVPRLSDVMRNGSIDSVRRVADGPLQPNSDLVRNRIVVDRGILRVRNVVMWDHGAFPLSGNRGQAGRPDERGRQAATHAALKFVGSNWQGHAASEFVVDVWDANSVELASNMNQRFTRDAKAEGNVNHRVPYDAVEILITNYEVQEHTAVPWGLDFQWLFERVGYPAIDLDADFTAFDALAATFDRDVYDNDRRMLLESVTGSPDLATFTRGRPFPYVVSPEGVERLTPLNPRSVVLPAASLTSTDEEDRPICIGGFK